MDRAHPIRAVSHGGSETGSIGRELDAASRTLDAFAEARRLATRARQGNNADLASDLDRFAWNLLAGANPVRVSYAQKRLGISNPTVRAWIDRGFLEHAESSPQRVTLESLARVANILGELRRQGHERDLTAALERRLRWETWRQSQAFASEIEHIRRRRKGTANDHRAVEARSVAFHRRIAKRLDRDMVDRASERTKRWARQDAIVPASSAKRWQALLERPLPEIRRRLVEDSEEMRDLRQNTPFAGALPERERMRLMSEARVR